MKSLVISPNYSEDGDLQYNHYKEPRSHLEESLQRSVLPDRDREITHVLIRHYNQTFCEPLKNTNLRKFCQKIVPIVLKSVLRPSVNDLETIPAIVHPNLMD
jgi:hypothetical protein